MTDGHRNKFTMKSGPLLFAECPKDEAKKRAREEMARLRDEGWTTDDRYWQYYKWMFSSEPEGAELKAWKYDIELDEIIALWPTKIFDQGFESVEYETQGGIWLPEGMGQEDGTVNWSTTISD